jgi:FxsC-like protein
MNGNVHAPKDYQFFLSYSRRDARGEDKTENTWFARFRKNLALDVAREAKLPSAVSDDDVGFYDRVGIELGDRWTDTLAEALQSSRVLVAVYSANYFNSPNCGKEFQVFSERVAAHEAAEGGPRPGFIIPVLWDAPGRLPVALPETVDKLQFSHSSLGDTYASMGLMSLLRLGREQAYQEFLMALAQRIAKAATMAKRPPRVASRPLDKIESAFHASATQPSAAGVPSVKGVKAAWLVYFAGAEADYAQVRQQLKCYGTSGSEWQPYFPGESLIGAVASNVASGRNLSPQPLAVTQQLVSHLQDAEDNNTMAVIIVDPWSIYLKSFEAAMKDLDRARLTNCGVIIVWNGQDPETQQKAKALEALLKRTFSRIWTSKDVYFQHSVPNEDELRKALGSAIDEVRRRISDRGRLLRGEAADEAFPTLPTGNTSTATTAAEGTA